MYQWLLAQGVQGGRWPRNTRHGCWQEVGRQQLTVVAQYGKPGDLHSTLC